MRIRAMLACALAVVAVQAPLAEAHEGNPNYRSEITGIEPAVTGSTSRSSTSTTASA